MLPDWFFEKLAAEAHVITQAPISFVICISITTLIAWLILRSLYRERLDGAKSLVGLYKDKFGLLSGTSVSPVANLRNRELRKRAQSASEQIRQLAEDVNASYRTGGAAITATPALQHALATYEKNIKQDAILFAAEMRARMSANGIADPGSPVTGMGPHAYEHPTNSHGLREVASDLSRLSKLLP